MPHDLPDGFKTALAGGTIPLRTALRITRKDGTIRAFCTGQLNRTLPAITRGSITIPETTYDAHHNMTPTNLVQSDDLTPNNMEYSFVLGSLITEDDIDTKRFEGGKFSLIIFCPTDLTWQILVLRGQVGEVSADGSLVTMKLKSLSALLQQDIIDVTSPLSRYTWNSPEMSFWDLADDSADGFSCRITTTIDSIIDARREIVLSDTIGFPAGRFIDGTVKFLDGDNEGEVKQVQNWTSGNGHTRFWHPTDYDMSAGDSVEVTIKCPLTVEEWYTVFGDVRHFGGEPDVTTLEAAAEVKDEDTTVGDD